MSKPKSKPNSKKRPSGVTMTTNRSGQITFRSYGPNAPDLRHVIPGLFAGALPSAPERGREPVEPADGECKTCLGVGRIRDGETDELRRCLDCGVSRLRRIEEAMTTTSRDPGSEALAIYVVAGRDVSDALEMIQDCDDGPTLETLLAMLVLDEAGGEGSEGTDRELNALLVEPVRRALARVGAPVPRSGR